MDIPIVAVVYDYDDIADVIMRLMHDAKIKPILSNKNVFAQAFSIRVFWCESELLYDVVITPNGIK